MTAVKTAKRKPTSKPGAAAALVRAHDPDRFLATVFAPVDRRETLFLLYAFNHELARAREVASEPHLALIRLHWWREVAEGARRRHDVAGPLGAAIDRGELPATALAALVDARETEVEAQIATRAKWLAFVRGTAGALAEIAAGVLGADASDRARLGDLGAAYGIAGQLRSVAALARQGRCLLPADVLATHGLNAAKVIAKPQDARLVPVLRELGTHGRALLHESGGRLPRELLPAALPAVLARRDLQRLNPAQRPGRGIGDKAAVLMAWLTRRV